MLVGGQDPIVDPAAARELYDRLGSEDKTLLLYPKMLHEPLNELGREQVLDDLARWIEPRLARDDGRIAASIPGHARTNRWPGMPADQPLHLQHAERRHHLRGGQAGAHDQLVDAGRRVVEPAEQRALGVGERQLGGMAHRRLIRGGPDLPDQRAELFEDVVDRLDQPGAVADQAVAAAAAEAVDRPGHGEDLAVLLHGVIGRRQRAAPRRRLDHDDAQAQAGDDPVPLR